MKFDLNSIVLYIYIYDNLKKKHMNKRNKTTKGTSWVVRHYPKANTTWLTAAIMKIDTTSYFSSGCSDLDEIRQPDAE